MSNEENKKIPKPQGLVLFKTELEESEEEENYTSFEDIDQENAIKLLSELKPFASHYMYSILLINESAAPITEVKVKLKFPDFLKLARVSPPSVKINPMTSGAEKNVKLVSVEFFELPENSKRQINFFFTPITVSDDGEFSIYVTFVNAKDFVRVLNSNPIPIEVKPITLEPKIIPSNQIQPFLKREGIKKAVKSVGLGIESEINFALIFNHLEQILKSHNFQIIAKNEERRIIWTFGTELESKEDILMIGQIVANKIEFLGASSNHSVLIPLLTNLIENLKKRVISMAIILEDNQIHELDCHYCGMILPRFPAKGESVDCPKCNKENVIW